VLETEQGRSLLMTRFHRVQVFHTKLKSFKGYSLKKN
jgi:hypothetical protein